MHPSLNKTAHRQWPIPNEKWNWRQSWLNLGFAHFRVSKNDLRNLVPTILDIDEYDGTAWVSIVPFRMFDVMRRGLPSFYPIRNFPELNLRTYVNYRDRPGVWFFSLDAACLPFVLGARYLYGLPYFNSTIKIIENKNTYMFDCTRKRDAIRFQAKFNPSKEVFLSKPGTFDFWVTERYRLYSTNRAEKILYIDVHHEQWPLQNTNFDIQQNELFNAAGLKILDSNPIFHFSSGVHVVSFPAKLLNGS